MLFDFSNKKKTKRIAAIICGVLVFAMVVVSWTGCKFKVATKY